MSKAKGMTGNQEAQDQKQVAAPPAPRPRVKSRYEIEDCVNDIQDGWMHLQRSLAAWTGLVRSLQTLQSENLPGERTKGLPIFKMTSTADGKTPLEVVFDMKLCPPDQAAYVMTVFGNMGAQGTVEALNCMEGKLAELRKMLQMPQQAADEPTEEVYEPPEE